MYSAATTVSQVEHVAIEIYDILRDGHGGAAAIAEYNPVVLQGSWGLLERLGLAQFDHERERCVAVEPGVAIGRLLALCRSVLRTRELDVTQAVWPAAGRIAPARSTLDSHPEVCLVAGNRLVSSCLTAAYRAASERRATIHRDAVPVSGRQTRALLDLAEQDVAIQVIYKRGVALSLGQRRHLRAVTEAGVQVRLDPSPLIDMIISDGRTVVLPPDPDRPGGALALIDSPVWAHAAQLVFQQCWEAAGVDHATAAGPAPLGLARSAR